MAWASALLMTSVFCLETAAAGPAFAPSGGGTPAAATVTSAPTTVASAPTTVTSAPMPTVPAPATPADRSPDAAPAAAESRLVDRFRDRASDMVLTAMNFLGTPYRRGGDSADHGFDCSGFTRHVFEMSLGLMLPRRADEQAGAGGLLRIDRAQLRPGDLVFFNTMRRTFSHVGIYVGAGKFIHSPKPGGEVRVDDLQAGYWDKRFTGGRRAEPAGAPLPAAPAATGSLADVPAVN